MSSAGAAVVLTDSELTPERLRETVSGLLVDPARLERMRSASRDLARTDAAAAVAAQVMIAAGRRAG
jgi:UDP-N-acetylglucosamine--N-acetylmuramyl-(pentapeptide) pyrophosphoryl-undecaprenol N-acetylglucosamine transferase